MSSDPAFLALLALAVEALRWASLVAVFLFLLYWLVRFVKWAWTDVPPATEAPWSPQEWGAFLDAATGHTSDGRPICTTCGVPIAEGEEVLLTKDERDLAPPDRPGAFRHRNATDCRLPVK